MIRAFFGISLPVQICDYINDFYSGIKGAKWIISENIHLTLRFIGNVDKNVFDDIALSADKITASPFSLVIKGMGVFPSIKNPKVLHLSVKPEILLDDLKQSIDDNLSSQQIEVSDKKFIPHITIAKLRNADRHDLIDYLSENGGFLSEPIKIDSFHLYTSELLPDGAIYNIANSYRLG